MTAAGIRNSGGAACAFYACLRERGRGLPVWCLPRSRAARLAARGAFEVPRRTPSAERGATHGTARPGEDERQMWSQLSEDVLSEVFKAVAASPAAGATVRGLAAAALVCRHWREAALGDAVAPLWRALHWECCRHTDPPLPDLVVGLGAACGRNEAVRTYRRRAVCSRAHRQPAHAPVFFQARGRADQGVLVPADTLQVPDKHFCLRHSFPHTH